MQPNSAYFPTFLPIYTVLKNRMSFLTLNIVISNVTETIKKKKKNNPTKFLLRCGLGKNRAEMSHITKIHHFDTLVYQAGRFHFYEYFES